MRKLLLGFAATAMLAVGTPCHAQGFNAQDAVAASDTPRVRRHAIEYSDWYNTRLTIHRWGSYTMLPLFAGEYYLGDRLLNGVNVPDWYKGAHAGVATGLGALFTVNTVTGVWNLWDSRNDPAGRKLRYVHTGLMLAADAGFAWAGAVGGNAKHDYNAGVRHRNIALGSIGLSTLGTAIMWFRRD
ncbi:MAG: hypothetical protein ABI442_21475 [Gemmatimonadaceae bacterium]